MVFLEGYLYGLALVVLIGPVLFVLLQSTLEYGKLSGFMVAFGIFVSDIIAVLLCNFGASGFFSNPQSQFWLAIAGGLILLTFGIKYLLNPTMKEPGELKISRKDLLGFFTKGFLVNFVNPFVFTVWIGFIGLSESKGYFETDKMWYFVGMLLGIFTLDTTKVFLAHKIRPLLRPNILKIIFRVSGGLLILFGVYVLGWAFLHESLAFS